jgi:hypothetical protein
MGATPALGMVTTVNFGRESLGVAAYLCFEYSVNISKSCRMIFPDKNFQLKHMTIKERKNDKK